MHETTFYIDSSFLLRILLSESKALGGWSEMQTIVSSRLLRLECMRVIDRYRLTGHISDETALARKAGCFDLLKRVTLLPITEAVLHRAEGSFLTPVKALDSVHVSTALLWRDTRGKDFTFVTHDVQLARVVHAHGINVIGVE